MTSLYNDAEYESYFSKLIAISKIANVCVTVAHKFLRMQMSTAIKTNKSKKKKRRKTTENIKNHRFRFRLCV